VTVIVESPDEIRILSDDTVIVGRQSPFDVKLYHKQRALFGTPSSLIVTSSFELDAYQKTITPARKTVGHIRASFDALSS
jgi:hypothetical protein